VYFSTNWAVAPGGIGAWTPLATPCSSLVPVWCAED
jgi:hypothetical protein